MASLRNEKHFETGLLLGQCLSFKECETYITAIVLKLYKNKNLRCLFKVTADAAEKGKLYSICSMPEISAEVKVSRNGPERRSGKIIIAGSAFRLEQGCPTRGPRDGPEWSARFFSEMTYNLYYQLNRLRNLWRTYISRNWHLLFAFFVYNL